MPTSDQAFTKKDFQEFLASSKQKPNTLTVQIEERKAIWLNSLESLYIKIKIWLQDLDVKIEERQDSIYEQFAGEYKVPVLVINFLELNENIGFFPIGMFVLGADGKVEVAGRFSKVSLIEKSWDKWEILKITPGNVERTELTEENFYKLIKQMVQIGN